MKKILRKLITAVIKSILIKTKRVRDHCHITGKYRGSCYQHLNFQLTDTIPVIFHNLRRYDSHFIVKQIDHIAKTHTYKNKKGEEKQMNIDAIHNNSFMLGYHLVFIDSCQF